MMGWYLLSCVLAATAFLAALYFEAEARRSAEIARRERQTAERVRDEMFRHWKESLAELARMRQEHVAEMRELDKQIVARLRQAGFMVVPGDSAAQQKQGGN